MMPERDERRIYQALRTGGMDDREACQILSELRRSDIFGLPRTPIALRMGDEIRVDEHRFILSGIRKEEDKPVVVTFQEVTERFNKYQTDSDGNIIAVEK